MSNNSTVSVVVTVYNRPQLLKRALNSVLHQTYKDWECIIVDDGSTDNTLQVVQEFSNQDKRFKVIPESHKGRIQARNTGVALAQGDYFTFLDSDDEYTADHITLRVRELQDNPKIDMLQGGLLVVGDEMVPDKRDVTKEVSLYDLSVYLGGTIFAKREVFEKLGGFTDISYGSGSDFVEKAMTKFCVKRVTWPTYIYHRDHEDSTTDKVINTILLQKR